MACTAHVSFAPAPTLFAKGAPATRASPPSRLKAPALLKGTPFLGGLLAQSAQTCKVRRSRPASITRAQAVSTSAPELAGHISEMDELMRENERLKEKVVLMQKEKDGIAKQDPNSDTNRVEKTVQKDKVPDALWLKLHGVSDDKLDKWAGLLHWDEKGEKLEKLDDKLRDEVIKYGEMAQLTYDSVDLNQWSRYRDQNRFSKADDKGNIVPGNLFGDNLTEESFFQHLPGQGYEPVAYLYVSYNTKVIKNLRDKTKGQRIENDVWMGYIAYSKVQQDIVIAWRGTQKPAEWVADGETSLMSYKKYPPKDLLSTPATEASKDPGESKGGAALLAFLGAAGYGAISAGGIAFLSYLIFGLLFEAEGLLGIVFNAAFGAVAAMPVCKFFIQSPYEFVKKLAARVPAISKWIATLEDKVAAWPINEFVRKHVGGPMGCFALIYALVMGGLTLRANLATPGEQFWTADALIFIFGVILPTGLTAAIEAYQSADEGPQVHEGFYEMYDPTEDPEKTTKTFPRKVVRETLKKLLLSKDRQEVRTISVTGHSLGGALAVLSAYDIVASGLNVGATGKRIPVACFAFEAPRVGNPKFKESFDKNKENGLAAIRVVNKPDIVTQVPKAFYLQNVYYLLAAIINWEWLVDIVNNVEKQFSDKLPSAYVHVGQELRHDSREVDYLKKMGWNPVANLGSIGNYHNLELNLHLVSGYWGKTFTRDFALCNKSADAIDERAGIPPCWFGTPKVRRAARGDHKALIEPYSKELPPIDGQKDRADVDNERKIGQGPATAQTKRCEPLVKDYFARYPPLEQGH